MDKFKKIFKIILPLILGGFFVWYSLRNFSIETISEHFIAANYYWVGLGVFLGVLSHLSRAYRWKYLLEPIGYKPKFANSFMAVMIGYLVNLAFPRAGEISRASVLTNYEKIPFEKAFGTIVAERMADALMLLLIISITLIVEFDFILELFLNKKIGSLKMIFLLILIVISGLIILYFIKKSKKGFLLKIKSFINGLIEGFLTILKMKYKWPFIFHTFFIWSMYILMFWITSNAIDGLSITFDTVLLGFIAGTFSIALTNGGIGSYPIAINTAFLLYGINSELSIAFGWIIWSSQILIFIILGSLSFLMLPIYNTKFKK